MTAPQQQLTAAQAAVIAGGLIAASQPPNVTDTVSHVSMSTAARISAITLATKNVIQGLWLQTNPYSDKSVKDFAVQANQILVAAQQSTGKLSAAAQSIMLQSMGVRSSVVPKLDSDIRVPHAQTAAVTYQNAGKPDTTVHMTPQDSTNEALLSRPAVQYRHQESIGKTAEQAQAAATSRIDDVVDGNLLIAQRDAEHQAINGPVKNLDVKADGRQRTRTGALIVGYRRIIHPEFSTGGVCGLCIAASDRMYLKETLRPIHLRCKCTSAPVTAKYDPGLGLNNSDIGRLYTDGGGTGAAALKKTRYTVIHSELGPTLVAMDGAPVPQASTTPIAA